MWLATFTPYFSASETFFEVADLSHPDIPTFKPDSDSDSDSDANITSRNFTQE